jgi:hypothetical protein
VNLDVLKKIEKKHWYAIVGGATVLVVGAFAWLSWQVLGQIGPDPELPASLQRTVGDSKWEQIAQRKNDTAALQDTIRKRPQVEQQLKDMKADIDAARGLLPPQSEKAVMRDTIDRLAREIEPGVGTVRVKSVSIREAASAAGRGKGPEYQSVEYVTQLACDMDGLIAFIDRIEKYDRFMSVDNFQLTTGGVQIDKESKKPVKGLHNVTMKIVTYIYNGGK